MNRLWKVMPKVYMLRTKPIAFLMKVHDFILISLPQPVSCCSTRSWNAPFLSSNRRKSQLPAISLQDSYAIGFANFCKAKDCLETSVCSTEMRKPKRTHSCSTYALWI